MGCNCGRTAKNTTAMRAERQKLERQKLGTCKFCIYGTLVLSVIGWTAYYSIMHDRPLELLSYAYLALAIASTLLFSAHMGAIFIRRVDANAKKRAA